MAPAGIAIKDLAVGMRVTLSPNKSTGDRSFVDMIWEIAGINEGHLALTCCGFCHLLSDPGKPRLALIHEHEFYPAEHLATLEESPQLHNQAGRPASAP
jgi:hypothetical protein